MSQPYIILRSNRRGAGPTARGRRLRGAQPRGAAPAGLSVEVEDVSKRDLGRLASDEKVEAVAPSIPMRLIRPVSVRAVGAAGAGGGNGGEAEGMAAGADPGRTAWGVTAVGADKSPFTGEGVVVAVLDTGIDATHPAFEGVRIVERDFTGEGNGDTDGHGTHCAGTIFGRDVHGTRIGVARGVETALIGKVLGKDGGIPSGQLAAAIQWAVDNGAAVISMSLGIDFPGFVAELQDRGFPPELATSVALDGYRMNVLLFERLASLIRGLEAEGGAAVIVAAAGNESRRDENPEFEIGVSPPAVSEGILSVAALGRGTDGVATSNLMVAPFSNTGAIVAGPGVDILSARAGGGLDTMSGTSMATPHVAGVAALWAEQIARRGRVSARKIMAQLSGTASTDALASDVDPRDVGDGLVRAPQK